MAVLRRAAPLASCATAPRRPVSKCAKSQRAWQTPAASSLTSHPFTTLRFPFHACEAIFHAFSDESRTWPEDSAREPDGGKEDKGRLTKITNHPLSRRINQSAGSTRR